ncbi:MAG TPA: alpha/beta hydrolase [Acidimicrobiales bacterium]|jgi:pimeloyl-ACP methyl ester carboxylesterase
MASPASADDGDDADPAAVAPNLGAGLSWRRTWVDDRPALYAVGGEGLPVLFLHGWALGHRSYRGALHRLLGMGCRVHAPALPGFGGTADLPGRSFSLGGYAEWADRFLDAVGVDEPALVVGHSFGGGVAIKLAAEHPDRVSSLALVNSIGGSAWKEGRRVRSMAERPLWDWGLHFPSDVWPLPQATRILPVMLEEALPNLVRNPMAIWRVAQLARRADLTRDLEALKERGLPVAVIWGRRDGVITKASFEALCRALGCEGEVVEGSHSWLLADPDTFGEVITNVVAVAKVARELEEDDAAARRTGFLGRSRRRPRTLRTVAGATPADEVDEDDAADEAEQA